MTAGVRRIGVYPGTFDPITNGHRDIIARAMKICDELIVGVAANVGKEPLFTGEERAEMARRDLVGMVEAGASIEVRIFDNLLMDFAADAGATCIIRGLRAVSDFEYEFQMAVMNSHLNAEIETVFLMASEQHLFIASRLVKEIARLGGDISGFVSPEVQAQVIGRLKQPHIRAVAD